MSRGRWGRFAVTAAKAAFVAAVYSGLGIMLALGVVDAIDRELDHREVMGRESREMALEMGLGVAVENPVERRAAAVSNSLDIDLALIDKHPHGSSFVRAAMCGKPL